MTAGRGIGLQVQDSVVLLEGTPDIAVALRKSTQARRLSLRVSGLDGRVTLTLPRSVPLREALAFLRAKEDWLRRAIGRVPVQRGIGVGDDILLRGTLLRVVEDAGLRRVSENGAFLKVPSDPDRTRTPLRLAAYLKTTAQSELLHASQHYAAQIDLPIRAMTLRDTRSRWGSCTADGRLMFSWRLIMAPPPVLQYVAAHEVAHLRHMDHSPAFWGCVRELMPDYQTHRNWLRGNGAQLHSYRFTA